VQEKLGYIYIYIYIYIIYMDIQIILCIYRYVDYR